ALISLRGTDGAENCHFCRSGRRLAEETKLKRDAELGLPGGTVRRLSRFCCLWLSCAFKCHIVQRSLRRVLRRRWMRPVTRHWRGHQAGAPPRRCCQADISKWQKANPPKTPPAPRQSNPLAHRRDKPSRHKSL